ncbi:NAD(P)-dependent alcohol dehydrogenase [Niallia circulans]|uniref:NAD(P)-dependent alcohol dehydrogenase n=1 Tax=Niallia circulans TaxID=1397 RepID=A0A553SJ74_NIACI|nr:NAD(P)-dependent alcohol dehydrogenase [Niallia circulans]TRZ37041.1 NAD(P)-dependent alcohol dehydrogenase [Niallia circulans]
MKAIVSNKYGTPETLGYSDINRPLPKEEEVLVKIHAASLNYGNLVLLSGKPFLARFAFGLLKPKYTIPGSDIAGVVEAVGNGVTQFKPGDEVFGDLSQSGWGGFAEYAAVPEKALAIKPENLSFAEAAAVPMAGTTALQALRNTGKILPGQKVLINGASGGVGTFAVQIAKALGAEVTGVCSTRNLEKITSIGADYAIDYTKEDVTNTSKKYDLILAVNGYQTIHAYKKLLTEKGRYVMVGGNGKQMRDAMLLGPFLSLTSSKKFGNMLQQANQSDLNFLKELIEQNKLQPVIDKEFLISEAAEAYRYLQKGHAQGKIIIKVAED